VATHLWLSDSAPRQRRKQTAVAGQQPATAVLFLGNPAASIGKFALAMAKKALQRRIWRRQGVSA
jgi:hypothetical protein